MNWEAAGAIGEIFGALAVVITLIYLSRQLRENSKSLKVQSLNTTFGEYNSILKEIQSLEGIGSAYRKMLLNEPLSIDEEFEIGFMLRRILNINDKMLYLHSMNAADAYNQAAFERSLPVIVNTDFFRSWWPNFKNRYSDMFQDHVEKFMVAESISVSENDT